MFGKMTQTVEEWHPDNLLCRRFNVPNPFPEWVPSAGSIILRSNLHFCFYFIFLFFVYQADIFPICSMILVISLSRNKLMHVLFFSSAPHLSGFARHGKRSSPCSAASTQMPRKQPASDPPTTERKRSGSKRKRWRCRRERKDSCKTGLKIMVWRQVIMPLFVF